MKINDRVIKEKISPPTSSFLFIFHDEFNIKTSCVKNTSMENNNLVNILTEKEHKDVAYLYTFFLLLFMLSCASQFCKMPYSTNISKQNYLVFEWTFLEVVEAKNIFLTK